MRTLLLILLLSASLTAGEVVDRIAATAKLRAITVGEIRRYIRIISTLEGAPADYGSTNLRRVAELLVNQRLIASEMDLSGYQGVPMSAIEKPLQDYLTSRSVSYEQLLKVASESGLSEEEVRREFRWRYSVAQFVLYRFRPVVQVSDEEIEGFYKSTYVPERTKSGAQVPPLAEVLDELARQLEGQKIDTVVQRWLADQQKINNVVYYEEALK